MAEPSSAIVAGVSCIFTNCDNTTCEFTCVGSDPFTPPPPPPPPPPISATQNGVAPYLIATVCVLGISFLLLSTCTIILRYRFSRRRTVSPARFHDPSDGGGATVDHPIWHISTVGLQQSVIDSITAFKYKKFDELLTDFDSDCSVCLTEFEDGDDLRLLPKCCHAFHVCCIDTWLRSHTNCPLCRAPVIYDESGSLPREFSVVAQDSEQNGEFENNNNANGGSVSLRDEGSENSHDFVELHNEGVKIAEILKRNRELRIFSDLGVNYRFRGENEDGVEPIRRSFSFNYSAANSIYTTLSDVSPIGNDEGCSSNNTNSDVQEKKFEFEKVPKWGSTMSALLKTSSFGPCSLHKGPVSMKRSFSSGGKFFPFRRTKNQASILPL